MTISYRYFFILSILIFGLYFLRLAIVAMVNIDDTSYDVGDCRLKRDSQIKQDTPFNLYTFRTICFSIDNPNSSRKVQHLSPATGSLVCLDEQLWSHV